MKRFLGILACFALILAVPAVNADALADEPTVLVDMLMQNDTGDEPVCDTDYLTCVRAGHTECDDASIEAKTEELTRAALQCAREECRTRGCGGIHVRSIEREVVKGGYSCGVTITVTYCCTDCPD